MIISRVKNIYQIGTAFGFSTFVLNTIFPDAHIDTIDANVTKYDPMTPEGSEITQKIVDKFDLDVNLTIGRSPEDNCKAMTVDKYDLIFIDGHHRNYQLLEDFGGIEPFIKENSCIVCHDVKAFKMMPAVNEILERRTDLIFIDCDQFDY